MSKPLDTSKPLMQLRIERTAGATVHPVEVNYYYQGVQNGRHTVKREEIDLIEGEITAKTIHGGTAKQ